jgi:NAD(P)-dependent dehydrogenase (short-subunit alcohol dehydrogenase family)
MTVKQQDPTEQEVKPPFPEQEQAPPGLEQDMEPRPDFGEDSYRGSGRLAGKVAIVTGGDSGIGRAVVLAFAREGADVLISHLAEEEPDAREAARAVEDAGRRALTVAGDIGDEEHCDRLVSRVVDELGGLDVLVNNAATQRSRQGIAEISADEWRTTFRTNIDAMFYLCKAALPKLRDGGTIINVTSIQAYQPSASLLAYATTKGAILTFTRALAVEALQRGIRVNAVAPGPVWTPLIVATMGGDKASKFGEDNPMGRPAQPAELAPLFVFLASQESSYINGEVIGVTGGKPLG